MCMKIQQRGTFRTVVYDGGDPISILTKTVCTSITRDDKNVYMHLDIPQDGTHELVETVDTVIRQHQPRLEYSPWLRGSQTLVTKVAARCDPIDETMIGSIVEVLLKLGNFGRFGYCWQLHRIVALPE